MSNTYRSIHDADIQQEARNRLKELLHAKYNSILSKSAIDIGRTNLIELEISHFVIALSSLYILLSRTFVLVRIVFTQPTVGLHQVCGRTDIQHLIYVLGGSMCMLRQECSLSMLHKTCEKLHGSVRLGGLIMPNILCMPFYFKPKGVKENPIPYMV